MAPRTLLLSLALVAFSGFGLAYGDPTTESEAECTVDPTDEYPSYPEVYSTWSSDKAAVTDSAYDPECEAEETGALNKSTYPAGGYKSDGPGQYSQPIVHSTADPVAATPTAGAPYHDGSSGTLPVSTCTEEGSYNTFVTVTTAKSSDPKATYPAEHYGEHPSGSADPVKSQTVTVVPVPKYGGGEKEYYSAGSETASKDPVAPYSVSLPPYQGEYGVTTAKTTVLTTVTITKSSEPYVDPVTYGTTSTASAGKYNTYSVISHSKDPETTCTEEVSSTAPGESGYSVHTTSSHEPVSSTSGYPVYYNTKETKTSSKDPVTSTTIGDYGYHTYSVPTETSSTDPVTSTSAPGYGYEAHSTSSTDPVTSTTKTHGGYKIHSTSSSEPVTSSPPSYEYEGHSTSSKDPVTSTTTKESGYKVYSTSSKEPETSSAPGYGYEAHSTSSSEPVTSTTTKDGGYSVTLIDPVTTRPGYEETKPVTISTEAPETTTTVPAYITATGGYYVPSDSYILPGTDLSILPDGTALPTGGYDVAKPSTSSRHPEEYGSVDPTTSSRAPEYYTSVKPTTTTTADPYRETSSAAGYGYEVHSTSSSEPVTSTTTTTGPDYHETVPVTTTTTTSSTTIVPTTIAIEAPTTTTTTTTTVSTTTSQPVTTTTSVDYGYGYSTSPTKVVKGSGGTIPDLLNFVGETVDNLGSILKRQEDDEVLSGVKRDGGEEHEHERPGPPPPAAFSSYPTWTQTWTTSVVRAAEPTGEPKVVY